MSAVCLSPSPGPWQAQRAGPGCKAPWELRERDGALVPATSANTRLRQAAMALRGAVAKIRSEYAIHIANASGSRVANHRLVVMVHALRQTPYNRHAPTEGMRVGIEAAAPMLLELVQALRADFAQRYLAGQGRGLVWYRRWVRVADAVLRMAVEKYVAAPVALDAPLPGSRVQWDAGDWWPNAHVVSSYREASERWCAFRNATGLTEQDIAMLPVVVTAQGDVIAHLGYNGAVWAGEPTHRSLTDRPVFGAPQRVRGQTLASGAGAGDRAIEAGVRA